MRAQALAFLLAAPLLAQGGGALSAPTGLEAADGDYSTKVGLSWEHVRDAKTYRVFRAESSDPAQASEVGATESIIFYDRSAAAGRTYFYWIRAENAARMSPLSAPDQGFRAAGLTENFGRIFPLEPPSAPIGDPVTGAKVYLGKTLFWDEQLSSTKTVACGTCHLPRAGGVDPRAANPALRPTNPGVDEVFGTADDVLGSPGVPLSQADGRYAWSPQFGIGVQVTPRSSIPMINAAYSSEGLFWDGRALPDFTDPVTGEEVFPDAPLLENQALESQALHPFVNDIEMGRRDRDLFDLVARIGESQPLALAPTIPAGLQAWIAGRTYPDLFNEAFGSPEITAVKVAMALASYQRTLYSDRARIDRLVSQIEPFEPAEERGRDLFFGELCGQCHTGNLFGGFNFRFIGVRPTTEDPGRFEVTRDGRDRGKFRTPSLRNVELRAPFMHNGELATLEDTIDFYDRGGDFDAPSKDINFVRPLKLSAQEKADLAAFLRSLTDPRVAAEAGPLFDRPTLYSESARVPRVSSSGGPLQVTAIEPPMLGNPSFTVALSGAAPGAAAVLAIDVSDPGAGPAAPASAAFFRDVSSIAPEGFTSISLPLPDDSALEGETLYGRWYVSGVGQPQVSPLFEMTLFAPAAPPPAAVSTLTSVSAASLAQGVVAPESIVSGFGPGLATDTQAAASLPLPTSLAGIAIAVNDSAGDSRLAPLFFASPGQINFLVPPGTSEGEAAVEVRAGSRVVAGGKLQIASVAPALFAANANGRGVAAAWAVRVGADGSQTAEPTARFDEQRREFVSRPIAVAAAGEQVVLTLYGTGIRLRGDAPVAATVGGVTAQVLFAGPQPEFIGVDQVNVLLPPELAGRGETDVILTVGERSSNAVRVNVQ